MAYTIAADTAGAQRSDNNIVHALTTKVTRLKRQLHEETKALRDALAQAHGENLEFRRELDRRGSNPTT